MVDMRSSRATVVCRAWSSSSSSSIAQGSFEAHALQAVLRQAQVQGPDEDGEGEQQELEMYSTGDGHGEPPPQGPLQEDLPAQQQQCRPVHWWCACSQRQHLTCSSPAVPGPHLTGGCQTAGQGCRCEKQPLAGSLPHSHPPPFLLSLSQTQAGWLRS
jgi:hypothetical protein